jgi:Tfp pilus assembly protein PilF
VGKRNLWTIPIMLLVACLLAGCGGSNKNKSDPGEAHYLLGVSYLREHNPTMALKEFLLAAEAKPQRADIQSALGQAYHFKKAYSEAEEHYLRALQLDPENPHFQNNLAALYLDMERWDDAIRYFRKASDRLTFTSPEVALTGIGYAYLHKGEYLQAVTACKEALSHNSRYPQAYLRLGEAYYALDKSDLAIDTFLKGLALAPNFTEAHYKLALAYAKSGETDKAKASFRQVIRLAPDSEQGELAADYLKLLK